jgi:hypothetical protein
MTDLKKTLTTTDTCGGPVRMTHEEATEPQRGSDGLQPGTSTSLARMAAATAARRVLEKGLSDLPVLEHGLEAAIILDPACAQPETKAINTQLVALREQITAALWAQAYKDALPPSVLQILWESEEEDAQFFTNVLESALDQAITHHKAEFAIDPHSPATAEAREAWGKIQGKLERIYLRVPSYLAHYRSFRLEIPQNPPVPQPTAQYEPVGTCKCCGKASPCRSPEWGFCCACQNLLMDEALKLL